MDIRDYKFKNFICSQCDHKGKQKVQAEVDVAIAVKLMQIAQLPDVEGLTLFAGDRDFYDAIQHVQEQLNKPVQILAFKDNVSQRLTDQLKTEIILVNNFWPSICKIPYSEPITNKKALKLEKELKSIEDKELKNLVKKSEKNKKIDIAQIIGRKFASLSRSGAR